MSIQNLKELKAKLEKYVNGTIKGECGKSLSGQPSVAISSAFNGGLFNTSNQGMPEGRPLHLSMRHPYAYDVIPLMAEYESEKENTKAEIEILKKREKEDFSISCSQTIFNNSSQKVKASSANIEQEFSELTKEIDELFESAFNLVQGAYPDISMEELNHRRDSYRAKYAM